VGPGPLHFVQRFHRVRSGVVDAQNQWLVGPLAEIDTRQETRRLVFGWWNEVVYVRDHCSMVLKP
jgi:hypothetical protein